MENRDPRPENPKYDPLTAVGYEPEQEGDCPAAIQPETTTVRVPPRHAGVARWAAAESTQLIDLELGIAGEIDADPPAAGSESSAGAEAGGGIEHQRQLELLRLRAEAMDHATHELRSPIRSIIAGIEMLAGGSNGNLDPDQLHLLDLMLERAGRLQHLCENLIRLTQLSDGEHRRLLRPTDLSASLDQVARSTELLARLATVQLELDLPEDLPLVSLDPQAAEQALVNIVDHALRTTSPGAAVRLGASIDDNQVHAWVEAPGIGADIEATVPRLEGTAAPTGETAGGSYLDQLGLRISREIIEQNRGRIAIEVAEIDRIHLWLPIATTPAGGPSCTDHAS